MKKAILILTILFSISLANAQSKVVPLIDMKVGGLLGGVENGKYLDAKTTAERISAQQNYTLYLLNGTKETLSLKKPSVTSQDVCPDFYALEGITGEKAGQMSEAELEKANREIQNRSEKGGLAYGDGLSWNPQPRVLKAVTLNNAEYKKVVSDFLRTKGIGKHQFKLKQAVRVDLEGDGPEEVLLVASRQFHWEQKDGKKAFDEYSVVLMRKIVNGKPATIFIAGEFYPKNKEYYDGNIFALSSIADLNGDGKMELVVYAQYYEGNSTDVFEIKGNSAVLVQLLSVGCGL